MKYLLYLLLWLPLSAFAQQTFLLSGSVKSPEGEALPGATVYEGKTGTGVVTDSSGTYRLSLPEGRYTLQVSFIGYTSQNAEILLDRNKVLNITLRSSELTLSEVEVTAQSVTQKVETTQMSTSSITAKEAKLLPALFGEVDLIKILQLKPGVQSGSEGTSGLYIRGGGPDQNLILLDNALVYNASHLFGFFSIFNSDAVERVDLYKGDFPAQFGGRLSSVVDVKLRDGNPQRLAVRGGLGLISSRLAIETPLRFRKKDSTSQRQPATLIVSGRRTYFDVFTRQVNRLNKDTKDYAPIPDYFFHDLTARFNYQFTPKDRIYASGYLGRDVFDVSQVFSFRFDWGNTVAATGWNHQFNRRFSVNNALVFSDYNYKIVNRFDVFSFTLGSAVRDYNFRSDWLYTREKSVFQFGGIYTHHQFKISNFEGGSDNGDVAFSAGTRYRGNEFGLYGNYEVEVTPRLKINSGVRLSGFESRGKTWTGVEPRLSGRYKLSERVAVKGSFAQMYQYLHLVSNSAASLPTDVWYPSGPGVKPQRSRQAAAGISLALFDNKFYLSNESYYKWMYNQIDFKDGANLIINDDLDKEFVFGRGWSYGNEIYLEKKTGKTTGWIGYTLSYAWREFADINQGKKFHPRYDRRHDISVVVMHQWSKRLTLSATWVYGTGNAVSLPVGRFALQDLTYRRPIIVPEYTARNAFRLAPYHRFDLNVVWKLNPRRGEADLTFSVYNAYNRRNPFFIYFETVTDPQTKLPTNFKAKQVSLFPVIPSITYNFKF